MDTKSYVEYLLKNYHQIKREIEMLKPLLSQEPYESREETIERLTFQTTKEEKVKRSSVSNKTATLALSYRDENERINLKELKPLKEVIEGNERELLKLEKVIATLENTERKILEGIYIKRQSRRLLAANIFISEITLNRYRKRGVDQVVRVYEGYFGGV